MANWMLEWRIEHGNGDLLCLDTRWREGNRVLALNLASKLDEQSLKRNEPPQGGGINPYPHILGIHNREDSYLTINSSKPCITRINSPAVHAGKESVNNTRVNPAVTRKNSPVVHHAPN
ncbi:hypothetical protein PIB30_027869 [Stylosanthes scabra]|uniref:Uncharacterized protein n=1 Tax=Stylosanthes scabra TaxID=79078 RepID=A0ABU6W9C3_9FABA|nr:hypothetical protein [Stylosanthes scabra]